MTIATSKTQVSAIHNQLGEDVGISVEPCRRDTFPAIALATAYLVDVLGVSPEESVVVCPVDPYVETDYFEALKKLSDQADKEEANLVLMGIEPTYPSENTDILFQQLRSRLQWYLLSKRSQQWKWQRVHFAGGFVEWWSICIQAEVCYGDCP